MKIEIRICFVTIMLTRAIIVVTSIRYTSTCHSTITREISLEFARCATSNNPL